MKKLLLIIGIVLLIAAVLCMSLAVLHFFGYRRVLDGSPELYQRMHRRMFIFLGLGLVLAASGVTCLILYFKKQ